jgi:hypothetical protein
MADGFLSTNDLAKRWNLRPKSLIRWRQRGSGPAFLKFGRAVRYRIEDVIEYEQRSLHIPPTANRAEVAPGEPTTDAGEPPPRLTIKDVVAELARGRR